MRTGESAVHLAVTEDGWRIALARYPARAARRRHPVLLCHGLGGSRFAFDLGAERSLARHLAGRGYDVWVLELRGHGRSDRPGRAGRRWGWSFDDYLVRDLPAALAHVLGHGGAAGLHLIGHSMGGLLMYAHLARGGSAQLASAVAVGSSLDYSGSASEFHLLQRLLGLTAVLPAIPLGPLARALAPLVMRRPSAIERFNVWPSNIEPALVRRLHAAYFCSVSSPVLAQLATAMQPGGLRSADGAVRYLDRLGQATAPVLAIAGDQDRQCPPDAARATYDALGSPERALIVFGRARGDADHYGHFDLLLGRRAALEVWPAIDGWLDRFD